MLNRRTLERRLALRHRDRLSRLLVTQIWVDHYIVRSLDSFGMLLYWRLVYCLNATDTRFLLDNDRT